VLSRLLTGADIPATTYLEARNELTRVQREIETVFSEVDLLITPTSPLLPATIEEGQNPPDVIASSLRNTSPFDAYGIPTISVPCGFSQDGLPIGIQISGPHLGESAVFALAHAYEQATDWHNQQPSLA
jgi:aspartyl-tRNA(Asn)/glutamyl-tRNA(Gln) amidotransferase subunit A